jgi:hypothetical protein
MTTQRPTIDRFPIDSSAIASIGYSPEHLELEAEFRRGHVYRFFAVPPEAYARLMEADSKGAHFNREIRSRYVYERLEDP